MMKNSTDSSNAECDWATEDVPNAKTLLENEPENQQRWKQMPKDSNHSTNTYTATRTKKVITTTSTDDSSKRKNLPSVAKSDMYKTRMCRNYMETGRCKYGRVCQFAHGMKELRKYSLCLFRSCRTKTTIRAFPFPRALHNRSVDGNDRPDRGWGHIISNAAETASSRG